MAKAPTLPPSLSPFRVPDPAVARHPGALLAPRALNKWIVELPLANPPKAARMLLEQLRLLVRDPEPGARMGALLEAYTTPVDELQDVVDERLQNGPDTALPLDQLEFSLVELLSELAYGQLRIANSALSSGKIPDAELLYRALQLLERALNLERLRYYRPSLDGWRLLLSIFLNAEALEIADHEVGRELRRNGDPGTIQGLFYRALMSSLYDSNHRRPDQLQAWRTWTGTHANLLEMTVLPQGPYAMPIDISGSLDPLAAARRGKPGPEIRYLAADRFLQALQEDPQGPRELHGALHDLIRGRKSPEQRQNPRQPRNHPFAMRHGLRSIHARLSELIQGGLPGGSEPAPVACRQIDQSKSGSAFRLQGPLRPPLGIGDPVLMEAVSAANENAAVGFIGRIRRLVNLPDQQVEIGVEKLAGRLTPVELSGGAAQRLRGDTLALLQHDQDAGRYVLIAARSLFREEDSVTAEGAHTRQVLRMRGLLEAVQQTAYILVDCSDA